jgi:hypothetical protein
MGPVSHPPAYMPLNNNYGYMSPNSNKHMSMTAMPATDAFGNQVQPGNGVFGYPAPVNYGQGYPSPQQHMTQMHPQPSPVNEIFGTVPMQPQMSESHVNTNTQPGTEVPSLRASSPSSMHAVAPVPVVGGIEAFLQRQGRMSPGLENGGGAGGPPTGPYEMSASATHMRS